MEAAGRQAILNTLVRLVFTLHPLFPPNDVIRTPINSGRPDSLLSILKRYQSYPYSHRHRWSKIYLVYTLVVYSPYAILEVDIQVKTGRHQEPTSSVKSSVKQGQGGESTCAACRVSSGAGMERRDNTSGAIYLFRQNIRSHSWSVLEFL